VSLDLILHTEISNMIKKTISIKFGDKVREIRTSQNLSQEQLAHLADVHRTYIGMVERAEKNITLVNIEKIANALNVNLKDFFDYD
jgi:transcriptional regulator with XRE-family HTH domain